MRVALHKQSQLRAVAAYARPMDLLIVLPELGSYENLDSVSSMSVLAHEWTHYFQLVSTNAGHYISDIHRRANKQRQALLVQCLEAGWNGAPPLDNWIRNQVRSGSDTERVRDAVTQFDGMINEIHRPLLRSAERRGRRQRVSVRFGTGGDLKLDGESARVSFLQILEHAATCNEAIVSGLLPAHYREHAWADYFMAFWNLEERGLITVGRTARGWEVEKFALDREPNTVFLVVFLITQISLITSEASLQSSAVKYYGEKHELVGTKLADNLITEFMQDLAGRTFCLLMSRFEAVHAVSEDAMRRGAAGLEAADAVCEALKLPSCSDGIRWGLTRQAAVGRAEYQEEFEDTALPLRRFDVGVCEGPDDYERILDRLKYFALANLLEQPDCMFNPLAHSGELPMPPVMLFKRDGERRRVMLRFPPGSDAALLHIPMAVQSYMMEDTRVTDGLIRDREVLCYPDVADESLARSLSCFEHCPEFSSCWDRKCSGEPACTVEKWKLRARSFVTAWRSLQSTKSGNADRGRSS